MTGADHTSKNLSILQSAACGLGLLSFWGIALIAVLAGLGGLTGGDDFSAAMQSFRFALDMLLSGLLLVPALVTAVLHLSGKGLQSPQPLRSWKTSLIILLWPLLLWGSNWLLNQPDWGVLPFAVLRFAAILLMVFWFYSVAAYALPVASVKRSWGLLAAGILGGPLLSMLLEVAVLVILLAGVVIAAVADTGFMDQLNILATRLMTAGGDLDSLQRILLPYLRRPAVAAGILLMFSGIVPLIEEAIKPAGMWLLVKRRMTAADGFIAGVISGAGFGIMENLLNSTPLLGENWLLISSMRFGTTLLHMLASGLVGMGLASAWASGSYLKLAGSYSAAVILHGAWNAVTLFLGMDMLNHPEVSTRSIILLGLLGLFTLGMLGVMLRINLKLRKSGTATPPVTVVPAA